MFGNQKRKSAQNMYYRATDNAGKAAPLKEMLAASESFSDIQDCFYKATEIGNVDIQKLCLDKMDKNCKTKAQARDLFYKASELNHATVVTSASRKMEELPAIAFG